MKKIACILFVFILLSCSKESSKETVKRTAFSMGTTLEIQVITNEVEKADEAIQKAIDEVERINQKYSTYIKDNFMADLNAKQDTIEVDEETWFLLKKSEYINNLTEGRFDPAVGNLIKLVGFEKGDPHLPEQSLIDSVLKTVGWKHVEVYDDSKFQLKNGVTINFGGIAKGYAVDRAFRELDIAGFDTFLVSFGGEIRGKGKDWKVGIQHPRERNELLGELIINDIAVATSGDYEQFFKKDEKRYSHIIDPVTGIPSDETQSVTIIANNVTDADGLATGIFVLGPEKGMKIIENLDNVESLIVDKNGKVHQSSGLENYFRRN